MPESFVKRAPEIAEEILQKAARLPGSLRSFSQSLLTKEARADKERLTLPPRMTLEDLQKIASANGTDLPKIASVPTESAPKIAQELRELVKRAEREIAEDIFASAAALVLHRKQAQASVSISPAVPSLWTRIKAFIMGPESPAGFQVRKWKAQERAQLAGLQKLDPTSPIAELEQARARELAEIKATQEAGRRRGEMAEKMISATPAVALGIGTPLAAAALLKDDKGKKEEVKIYK